MLETHVLIDGSRRLRCVIEGESVVFTVEESCQMEIGELKEVIQRKRALDTLKDVGPHTLDLWKVSAIDESRCEVTWLSSLLFSPTTPILSPPSQPTV